MQTEPKKRLAWGETPWDGMTNEELLREVQRMYAAINAAHSVLRIMRATDEHHPFWGNEGSGGRALEMTRQVDESAREQYEDEEMYDAFYRYATDLLFDQSTGYRIGFGWAVCPTCGVMYGRTASGESQVGKECRDFPMSLDCPGGILRPIEWSDIERAVELDGRHNMD